MYIQKAEILNIKHELGWCVLDIDSINRTIDTSIIIQPERQFGYWNKRYEKALISGLINQDVYNAIINNQSENRVVVKLYKDIQIDKQELIYLINLHNLDIGTEQDSFNIISELNSKGYQIIKKV